ncbi:MAG: sulfite exporter TauE/SafE family protein [Oceanospirillaceae bacterium]|nr:sulfite exporter TauE/SafE family protein [Oceanospirillaceae bacterium]
MVVDWSTLLIVSVVSNLLSSLSGGGTGLLQLPAIIWLGLPFTVALATHKVTTIAMGVGATFYALKRRNLRRDLVFLLLISGLPGVLLGAHIVLFIPEEAGKVALGLLNISIGLFSFSNKNLGQTVLKNRKHTLKSYLLGAAIVFIIGIINGSLTSGTGLMVTMCLILWFKLDYRLAIHHTLVIVGVFWNAAGAASLASSGAVNWEWVAILTPGALIGSWLGVYLSSRMSTRHIKKLFELMAILSGIYLISP